MVELSRSGCVSHEDVTALLRALTVADPYGWEEGDDTRLRLLIARLNKIKIHVYSNDHPLPHFHVVIDDRDSASFAIEDCRKLAGHLPPRWESQVVKWARSRTQQLRESWRQAAQGQKPAIIEVS